MRVPDSCSNTRSSASVQGKGVSQTAPYSDGLSMERLSSAVIAHSKVTAFAWSAIRHIVPVVSSPILSLQPCPEWQFSLAQIWIPATEP